MSDEPQNHLDPTMRQRIGEQVRRLRQDAGLTRSELGVPLGLSAMVLRNLEQGMSAAPQTWRALLRHPSMQSLREQAQKEGLTLVAEGDEQPTRRALTVTETIDLYLDNLHNRGLSDSSILTIARVLRSVFRPALSAPLHDLSPERARHITDSLAARISSQTRRPLTERTRQAYQDRARAFLNWCVLQRRLPANPLDLTVAGASPTER